MPRTLEDPTSFCQSPPVRCDLVHRAFAQADLDGPLQESRAFDNEVEGGGRAGQAQRCKLLRWHPCPCVHALSCGQILTMTSTSFQQLPYTGVLDLVSQSVTHICYPQLEPTSCPAPDGPLPLLHTGSADHTAGQLYNARGTPLDLRGMLDPDSHFDVRYTIQDRSFPRGFERCRGAWAASGPTFCCADSNLRAVRMLDFAPNGPARCQTPGEGFPAWLVSACLCLVLQ